MDEILVSHELGLGSYIAGLLFILLFSYFASTKFPAVAKPAKAPPQAAGGWPIVGHLPLLNSPHKLPHQILGDLADRYGPVFAVRLGIHPNLVVSSADAAREIFTTLDTVAASRPPLVASKHMGFDDAMFGFAPYGAYWRQLRKMVSLELLSNRRLELLGHVRASEVEASMKELYGDWRRLRSNGGYAVDMKQWFGDLTLNVILRMVAGKRYFGSAVQGDGEKARRCQKLMREFFYLTGVFVVGDAIPFLGWMDFGGHEKAMKRVGKELDLIASEWLEEHRRKRDDGGEIEGEHDFMDAMLSALEGAGVGANVDADTINKATSMSLIIGGGDTTNVTLTWALSLLLNNRQVMKKAQEELDLYVGKERLVKETDISKLVYLQAILKETLRLYPPAPLLAPRQVTEDCTVGGYFVRKGTRLTINLHKIQRDPSIWTDSSDFQPERFLTTHRDVDVKGQHFGLIPFGSGRRACPGVALALHVVHLALATLLHAFDIWTPSDAPVDMTSSSGLTCMKATPLQVSASPRLPHVVYV